MDKQARLWEEGHKWCKYFTSGAPVEDEDMVSTTAPLIGRTSILYRGSPPSFHFLEDDSEVEDEVLEDDKDAMTN
eukprot:scaffold437496_cov90-Attheya_sp.AAC.1